MQRSDVETLQQFKTNPVLSETGAFRNLDITKPVPRGALFHSVCITSPHGLKVQFTDGPGLGESTEADSFFIGRWIDEIPAHDLLYWVVDGSSRDVAHIQQNMKSVLDATGYRDRLVVVLNKIDQILLPLDEELQGEIGWNSEYNVPSNALEKLIHTRAADLKKKLSTVVDIEPGRIVYCSARKRWNRESVLDTLLELLPEEKRFKASLNRHLAPATELMSERAKMMVAALDRGGR
jgi:predicted GTPase